MKIEVLIENGSPVVKIDSPLVTGRVDPNLSCEEVEERLRNGQSVPVFITGAVTQQSENRRAVEYRRVRATRRGKLLNELRELGDE